tara:strand:- start:1543 stop:1914 length:372 start_codon:yes stop_codon:yes gene_type:complete
MTTTTLPEKIQTIHVGVSAVTVNVKSRSKTMSNHIIPTYLKQADDLPVSVEFDYQPFEKQDRDYPGCDAEITLCEVHLFSSSIIDNYWEHDLLPVLTKLAQTSLRAACWEHIEFINREKDDEC